MMLMLTLDDAIKVTQRIVEDAMNDEGIIRQELEQKCWVPSDSEPAKQLYDLIFDINPAEICAQIEAGNLKNWCTTIQVEMNLALVRLPSAQPEIIHCESCEHWKNEHLCECLSRYGTFETPKNFYCRYGKEK